MRCRIRMNICIPSKIGVGIADIFSSNKCKVEGCLLDVIFEGSRRRSRRGMNCTDEWIKNTVPAERALVCGYEIQM